MRRRSKRIAAGAGDVDYFGAISTRPLIRRLCGPAFVVSGLMHFAFPKVYKRMVPPYLPAPETIVYLSGAAEIAGGVGLMSRSTRRLAGCWLIATLVAVFPANIHMALHAEDFPEVPGGRAALWARLPFQAVFVAWVRSAMRDDSQTR